MKSAFSHFILPIWLSLGLLAGCSTSGVKKSAFDELLCSTLMDQKLKTSECYAAPSDLGYRIEREDGLKFIEENINARGKSGAIARSLLWEYTIQENGKLYLFVENTEDDKRFAISYRKNEYKALARMINEYRSRSELRLSKINPGDSVKPPVFAENRVRPTILIRRNTSSRRSSK